MRKWIQIFYLALAALIIGGCDRAPFASKDVAIDQSLPRVEEIKTLTDMTAVAFEWKPSYADKVKGYVVYRSSEGGKSASFERVTIVNDKFASHYVDQKLTPQTQYYYKFSVLGQDDRESVSSEVISAKTLPLMESVSFVRAITGMPKMVKIIWRPHEFEKVCEYIIERNELINSDWTELVAIKGRLSAEYIDKDLKDNYVYRYRVRVKTCDGIVSNPSEIVEAKTKPLPTQVIGLKTTMDLPKKIAISWAPSQAEDLAYYKVYKTVNPNLFYTYLAKTTDTKFVDDIDSDGAARYYKVTVIDKDELESLKQENAVMGQSLPKPMAPAVLVAQMGEGGAHIEWAPSDGRAKQYSISRKHWDGIIPKEQKFSNILGTSFDDRSVVAGVEYKYSIKSVDEFAIESDSTREIALKKPLPVKQ